MNTDPNFKPNEMSVAELYPHFKEGMINLVKACFEDKQAITPAVFIGLRKNITDTLLKSDEAVQKQAKEIEEMTGEKDLFERNINAAMIDLEPFFKDTGVDALNRLGKDMGYAAAKDAIRHFERMHNINDVMFTVFISEAYVNERQMTEEEKNNPTKTEARIQEELDKAGGVRNTPGAKECVLLQFETRLYNEMVVLDFIRSENDNEIIYQEITNTKHLGKSERPVAGRFSGLLHTKENSVSMN
jgi:hypothetical protein